MKKINKKQNPSKGKKIKSSDIGKPTEGIYKKRPKFSLEYLPHGKKYCLSKCIKEEKASFADTIHALSQMTWQEIKNAPRHGNGFEIINRNSLSCKLPKHVKNDPSIQIYSMRFYARAPMLGYRSPDDGTFFIIAFDRKFKAYNHSGS